MDIVLGILGGSISLFTLMGFGVRFVILPWLEKKLLVSITLLLGEVLETKAEIVAVARMFDGHLSWSQNEVDRIWQEFNRRKK